MILSMMTRKRRKGGLEDFIGKRPGYSLCETSRRRGDEKPILSTTKAVNPYSTVFEGKGGVVWEWEPGHLYQNLLKGQASLPRHRTS